MLQASLGVVRRSAFYSLRMFAAPLRQMTDGGISGGSMGHTWKDKETAAEATVGCNSINTCGFTCDGM